MPKERQAGVSKFESCCLTEWDGGKVLKTIFPKEGNTKNRRILQCKGDDCGLKMSLKVVQRHQDPVPQIIHRFDLPSDDDRLGIRLYDADVSLEEAALPNRHSHD